MKNYFKLSVFAVLAVYLYLTIPSYAFADCDSLYGCTTSTEDVNSDINVDKSIYNPATGSFEDNISNTNYGGIGGDVGIFVVDVGDDFVVFFVAEVVLGFK